MSFSGPPSRRPTPQVSTGTTARTSTNTGENEISGNDTTSSFRGSDDSTLAGSIPPSPREPPAYGAERAPPQYLEADDPKNIKARRKLQRTLCIRLLTSIFITVLVSLIIAAVVVRIHDSNINTDWRSNETVSNKTNGTRFTIKPGSDATSVQPTTIATTAPVPSQDGRGKTTTVTYNSQAVATSLVPTPTTKGQLGQAVDCASMGTFANAIPVTTIPPSNTVSFPIKSPTRRKRKVHQLFDESDPVLGLSVYTVNGCLLSQAMYKGSDGLEYQCTMTCPTKRWERNQARHVVADEWGSCG